MTTYSAITAGEIDSDSPITDTLAGKWANNPIAIAEADATVPANLLPTVLLGTLTTTSGSTQTLSSLTLTPYKFLIFAFNAVSQVGAASISVGAASSVTQTLTTGAESVSGLVWVDLATGLALGATKETGSANGAVLTGATGYSTATTSVSVSTSNTFDGGSVRIYGVK